MYLFCNFNNLTKFGAGMDHLIEKYTFHLPIKLIFELFPVGLTIKVSFFCDVYH